MSAKLTPRQVQVAMLLARGMRRREVRERLGVSDTTITKHLARACARVGARTPTQLVVMVALQHERDRLARGCAVIEESDGARTLRLFGRQDKEARGGESRRDDEGGAR